MRWRSSPPAEAALRRTARRYSLCADDAEDAYQRAVEILLTKSPPADPRHLAAWMQVVTRREALAVRRSRERLLGPRADDTATRSTGSPATDRTPRSGSSAASRSPMPFASCWS